MKFILISYLVIALLMTALFGYLLFGGTLKKSTVFGMFMAFFAIFLGGSVAFASLAYDFALAEKVMPALFAVGKMLGSFFVAFLTLAVANKFAE